VCVDARDFELPDEPLVLYLFNPLPEAPLRQLIERLENLWRTLRARFGSSITIRCSSLRWAVSLFWKRRDQRRTIRYTEIPYSNQDGEPR